MLNYLYNLKYTCLIQQCTYFILGGLCRTRHSKIMKNVKLYIKKIGFTQKELAERLKLSRPTLDSYIYIYEHDQKIPKERYDISFHRLFDYESFTREEFENELQEIEQLFEKDKRLGILDFSPSAADTYTSVINNMKEDMRNEGWSEDIYRFINTIISGYRKPENKDVFKHLATYFLVLNNIIDTNNITDTQKPYLAKIYQCMYELTKDNINFDNEYYAKFLKRCNDIKKNIVNNNKHQEDEFKNKITEIINDMRSQGVEPTYDNIVRSLSTKQ